MYLLKFDHKNAIEQKLNNKIISIKKLYLKKNRTLFYNVPIIVR